MCTSLGHAIAGHAVGATATQGGSQRRFIAVCAVAAAIPDLDVSLALLPSPIYASLGGHRGITHSLAFAALFAGAVVLVGFRGAGLSPARAWLGLAGAVMSHSLLDMLTSYGNGVALFAPFSWSFVRFPWHPIDPDAASRGAATASGQLLLAIGNEALWVWLPALAVSAAVGWLRRSGRRSRRRGESGQRPSRG
jgi:inner membrane protein